MKHEKLSLKLSLNEYSHENKEDAFFKDVNLNILNKEFTFIVGMSGVGKTTLFDIMLGFYTGTFSGSVELLTKSKKYDIKKLRHDGKIGYISQEFQLLPWLNIKDNLYFPMKMNDKIEKFDINHIEEMLEDLNLDKSILDKYPHELSYGMKARISLSRVLLTKPKILFLDEFFTGIDVVNNQFIGDMLLKYISKTEQVIVVAITHELDKAIEYANKLYVLTGKQTLELIDKPYIKKDIINLLKEEE